MQFAKEYLNKTEIVRNFSDAIKFNLLRSDGKSYIRRKPNAEVQPQKMHNTIKHGGGYIMMWRHMSSSGVGNLDFIDSTMEQIVYLDILRWIFIWFVKTSGIIIYYTKHKIGVVQI